MAINYKEAGVDIHAGYSAVELIKQQAHKTLNSSVLSKIGSFGAVYELDNERVLVSGCDGVGTKLKVAFIMDKHDTVGLDCVAMCANDVVCLGAKPLFFLDYIATGKLNPKTVESIVSGIANGCIQAGCALIGGETAEMPGFYKISEYDIAGFCVGIADKSELIDGSTIRPGDVLIGLASSGIHSNGFSLIRSAIEMEASVLNAKPYSLEKTIGEELITPTKIYVKTILELKKEFKLKGVAHITGGGFFENIPRIFKDKDLCAKIELGTWDIPIIFDYIINETGISETEAYNTFNMGIGMVICVDKSYAQGIIDKAYKLNESAFIIGEVASGGGGVELCP